MQNSLWQNIHDYNFYQNISNLINFCPKAFSLAPPPPFPHKYWLNINSKTEVLFNCKKCKVLWRWLPLNVFSMGPPVEVMWHYYVTAYLTKANSSLFLISHSLLQDFQGLCKGFKNATCVKWVFYFCFCSNVCYLIVSWRQKRDQNMLNLNHNSP